MKYRYCDSFKQENETGVAPIKEQLSYTLLSAN